MKAIYHQFEPVILRWVIGAIVVALGADVGERGGRVPHLQRRPRPERSPWSVDRGRLRLQRAVHDVDAVHGALHDGQHGVSHDPPSQKRSRGSRYRTRLRFAKSHGLSRIAACVTRYN